LYPDLPITDKNIENLILDIQAVGHLRQKEQPSVTSDK